MIAFYLCNISGTSVAECPMGYTASRFGNWVGAGGMGVQ